MALHVFVFLLVVRLLLSLARLGRLCWFQLRPFSSRGGAIHSRAQRLLKPRTPLDCPDCRLCCTHSSVVEPAPPPVHPWREMKSRRGAPKRVRTDGFACPNPQCAYFGNRDAHLHALVGDGTHGHAEVQPRERGDKLVAQRYRQRTPAMAAGRTARRWTARDVLSCPLPPVCT